MVWNFRFPQQNGWFECPCFPTKINDSDCSQDGLVGKKRSPYFALQVCCSKFVSECFFWEWPSERSSHEFRSYICSFLAASCRADRLPCQLNSWADRLRDTTVFEALCAHRMQCSHEFRWPKRGLVHCGRIVWPLGVWIVRFPNENKWFECVVFLAKINDWDFRFTQQS